MPALLLVVSPSRLRLRLASSSVRNARLPFGVSAELISGEQSRVDELPIKLDIVAIQTMLYKPCCGFIDH